MLKYYYIITYYDVSLCLAILLENWNFCLCKYEKCVQQLIDLLVTTLTTTIL